MTVEPKATGRSLPTGTVTFLRSDVEGSMRLVHALGPAWEAVNATHLGTIRSAVDRHGGVVVRTEGDALFAAFPEAVAAVEAAVEAQRAIEAYGWPAGARVRVRIGLHTGEAHLAGDDYGGFDVNRAARVAAVGHGGQIVLSDTTSSLVADTPPPDTSLRDLGRHILRDVPRPERLTQVDVVGLPNDFPPLRTGAAQIGDLPDRVTSFVGREADVEQVVRLLGTARLVTLTGPGGIGKSSLAIEAAKVLAAEMPDGGWFVPLADILEPSEITGTIARAIGLHDGVVRTAANALPGYLAERRMVIVLDNLEHLLAGAETIASLVGAAPDCRFLVTSRAALHISGEQEFAVRPLDLVDGAHGARRLFIDRARAVRPDWDPGPDESVVDEICALLDGLPLGVELAAARIGVLPLRAIRDRLAANLPLPGGGRRDTSDRQRTLDATVAWSHDLLDTERQALLHELGVFEGGFDLEQVEAIVAARIGQAGRPIAGGTEADVLDDLFVLADQNLIVLDGRATEGVRFAMLRTIGTFALARLIESGGETDARRRHASAVMTLVEEAGRHLGRADQGRWVDRLDLDAANLQGALRWSIDAGEVELAQRMLASAWRYWQASGQLAEGRALGEGVLSMPGGDVPTVGRLWAVAATGNIAYWQADSAFARRCYDEEASIARRIGDEAGLADAIYNMSSVLFIEGVDEAAQIASVNDAIARFAALGDERGVVRATWGLGTLALGAGRMADARAILDGSLERFVALDDPQYHAMAAATLGWLEFASGNVPSAARLSVQAITETYALRDLGTTTISLHVGVLLAAMLGRMDDAARMTGTFDTLCQRYGVRPPAALARFVGTLDPFGMARAGLTPERYAAMYEEGRRMNLDAAVAMVAELGDAAAAGRGAVPPAG